MNCRLFCQFVQWKGIITELWVSYNTMMRDTRFKVQFNDAERCFTHNTTSHSKSLVAGDIVFICFWCTLMVVGPTPCESILEWIYLKYPSIRIRREAFRPATSNYFKPYHCLVVTVKENKCYKQLLIEVWNYVVLLSIVLVIAVWFRELQLCSEGVRYESKVVSN
jgi:hypothetical protein